MSEIFHQTNISFAQTNPYIDETNYFETLPFFGHLQNFQSLFNLVNYFFALNLLIIALYSRGQQTGEPCSRNGNSDQERLDFFCLMVKQ